MRKLLSQQCEEMLDPERDSFDAKRLVFIPNDFDINRGSYPVKFMPEELVGHCRGIVLMSYLSEDCYQTIQNPIKFITSINRSMKRIEDPDFAIYGDDTKEAYLERGAILKQKVRAALTEKAETSSGKAQSTSNMRLWFLHKSGK